MSALSPRQMFLLDEACKPIFSAFGQPPFLVGTAADQERKSYRDVDVRLILFDKKFDALHAAMGAHGIAFLGFAIGEYLASRTALLIDFQIQRQSEANERHKGARNTLGIRELKDYKGDAAPEDIKP